MRSRMFIFFILVAVSLKDYSQSQTDPNQPVVPQPIPPAPTAASLGKYGEVPVSKYTGIPDISIPIWQIKEGDIQVPISLSYHGGGVKVEENASWVGLGWSLNAGGVITRSVRGRPDEAGYLLNTVTANGRNNLMPPLLTNLFNLAPTASVCDAKDAAAYASYVAGGSFDSEPDIYFFNFNGMSGKFVLDQNGAAYTIPYQKLKIEQLNGTGWRITTSDGIQYTFGPNGATETTHPTNLTYSGYGGFEGDFSTVTPLFASAWYLSTIQSPTGHTVSFSYANEIYQVYSGQSQYLMWDISNSTNFNASNQVTTTGSKTEINGARLSSITFSNGHIDFIATKVRQDIDDYLNPNLLEKVVISNSVGVIKNFVLNTDYFTGSGASQTAVTRRLRLNSVTEWNGDMTFSKPPYTFSYDNTVTLPSKISTSQDHWGYYNGKPNFDSSGVPTLIPDVQKGILNVINQEYFEYGKGQNPISDLFYPNGVSLLHYVGADRTPDFNFAKTGSLTKITYPTGGYTQFEYEPHDYDLKEGNYVFVQPPSTSVTSESVDDPNPATLALFNITYSGSEFFNNATFIPSQSIPSNLISLNPTVSINLSFDFQNGGYNSYCCGYNEPEAIFTDLTLNKVLLDIQGREGVPQTIDQSIQDQINIGTVQIEGSFNLTTVPGDPAYFNGNPYFRFRNVQLDPTHTYQLQTITWESPSSDCESRDGCPRPAGDFALSTSTATASYSYHTDQIAKYNGTLGGLRIKKISDYSNMASPIIKHYTYRISANPMLSSGVIQDMPSYIDQGRKITTNYNAGDPFGDKSNPLVIPSFISATTTKYLSLTSGSKFELGQTSGSHVGYKEVQESYCADSTCAGTPIGSKIYRFTSADDYQDVNTQEFGYAFWGQFGPECTSTVWNPYEFDLRWATPNFVFPTDNCYPYPPKNNYDWKRGLPVSEEFYDKNGILRKKIESAYNLVNDNNNQKVINGLKIVTAPKSRINDMYFARYDIIAAWNYKTQDKVTEIDVNNNQIITTTNYFYDNPGLGLLTRAESVNSKNETLRTTYAYPSDFASQHPYDAMVNRFQVDPIIQKARYNSGNFLESTTTNYRDWGNGILTPETVQINLLGNPADTRLHMYSYDNLGNLLVVAKEKDKPINYLYDYHQEYPIAQVENPSREVVAYTSFEADGTGNWSIGTANRDATSGITGSKSYILNSDISKSGLTNTITYIVSYWTQNHSSFAIAGTISGYPVKGKTISYNGTGWTLYTHRVTGQTSVTINGTGHIDELRLFPVGAQMTTYTYDPLIGMTSQTDVGNRVTYYEYDGLQRLKRIRDQDYNILKTYEYQYQAPSGCGGNCYIVIMQTLAGTNTLGYPVGVFNVHGKLLGNATGPVQYASLWNADTADVRIGTLATGGDSLHFNMTINAGMSLPSGVTGCRYYQVDLAWNRLDGVRNFNGAYIDFGDGTGMRMGKKYADTPAIIAPNTTYASAWEGDYGTIETYFIHTYADFSLKTLTLYHNDATESTDFDNKFGGTNTGLQYLSNLRGNLPQNTPTIGGSCYQMASMTNLTNVLNWNSINTVQRFRLNKGDGFSSAENISYAQDFMKNNKGLISIFTAAGYRFSGYVDTTFRLSKLKSDWNTYFTDLQYIGIRDDHWNREDLSALTHLNFVQVYAITQNHQDDPNSPLVPLPTTVIDNVINQVAAGAGQTVSNGIIDLESAGTARTSASDTSVSFLKSKGWVIAVNGIQQ